MWQGLEGYVLPRKCNTEQAGRPKCPLDPYFILPDKCKCVDFQTLKLQEAPDSVPHGEMPRHMQLYVERFVFFTILLLFSGWITCFETDNSTRELL